MKYVIGGDGWWHTVEDKPVLTSDVIFIIQEDSDFYYLEVRRAGKWFGNLKINRVFLKEDFEVIEE